VLSLRVKFLLGLSVVGNHLHTKNCVLHSLHVVQFYFFYFSLARDFLKRQLILSYLGLLQLVNNFLVLWNCHSRDSSFSVTLRSNWSSWPCRTSYICIYYYFHLFGCLRSVFTLHRFQLFRGKLYGLINR
jgi:hypothetical protein